MKCKSSKKEHGAIAIDAVLGLTFFMLSILALMFMSMIIRVQSNIQYALGQTAKEVSGYFYLMDKFGLAAVLSGTTNPQTTATVEEMNSAVSSIVTFTSNLDNTASNINMSDIDWSNITSYGDVVDVGQLQSDAEAMCNQLQSVMENSSPLDQLKAIIQVFGKTLINKGFSYYASPLICKCMMPKYLSPNGDVDAFYEKTGIDPESIDFSDSMLLMDGRSVKLDIKYTMNTKSMTFGMIDTDLKFHQVATTAAWIRPDSDTCKKKLTEIRLPAEE